MAQDEYTVGKDADGTPVIELPDGDRIPLNGESVELCRFLNSSQDKNLPTELKVEPSWRFYCSQMARELVESVKANGHILFSAGSGLGGQAGGDPAAYRDLRGAPLFRKVLLNI